MGTECSGISATPKPDWGRPGGGGSGQQLRPAVNRVSAETGGGGGSPLGVYWPSETAPAAGQGSGWR